MLKLANKCKKFRGENELLLAIQLPVFKMQFLISNDVAFHVTNFILHSASSTEIRMKVC